MLLQDIPYPPDDGIKIKVYNLLLSVTKNYECHILAFGGNTAYSRAKQLTELIPNVKVLNIIHCEESFFSVIKRLLSVFFLLPPSIAFYANIKFFKLLRKSIKENAYDLIYYDIVNLAYYIKVKHNIPTIHSPNDATSLAYFRKAAEEKIFFKKVYLKMSAILLRRFERRLYPKFTQIHVVSPVDELYLKKLNKKINITVIPIAVEDSYLNYQMKCTNSGKYTLLFTGYLHNTGILNGLIEFIDKGLSRVMNVFPDLQFIVISKNPPEEILEKARIIPNIKIIEWVENYLQALLGADVIIMPDKTGTGLKNRVLQAFALGLPVIGSPIALEGFDFINGIHAFQCSLPIEMAEKIILLLHNEGLRKKIGIAARKLARDKYSLDIIGSKWVKLFNEVACYEGNNASIYL